MSTIKVNDIEEATSGGGKFAVARAWARWNMSGTAAIVDSFNVSSLTDLGVGISRKTFSNNFANADYCIVGQAGRLNDSGNRIIGVHGGQSNPTTSTTDMAMFSLASAYNDLTYGAASWFGDT